MTALHREFMEAAAQRVERAHRELRQRELARTATQRMHESAHRQAVLSGEGAPPRHPSTLGTCEYPPCTKTAVRFTPRFRIAVCDDHYGPQPPEPSDSGVTRSTLCHCGDPALFPSLLCARHSEQAAAALRRWAA